MAYDGPFPGTGVKVEWTGFTADVIDITLPSVKFEALKSTHQRTYEDADLGYTPGYAHTFVRSLLYDGGEVKLDVWFDPQDTSMDTVLTTPSSTTPYAAVEVTISFQKVDTPSKWVFYAFVTGYEPQVTLEELMKASITLKVTGKVTVSSI